MIRSCCVLLLLCFYTLIGQSAALKALHVENQKNKSSVFLTVDGAFTHKLFQLPMPQRVVLDLNNTELRTNFAAFSSPIIQKLRSGRATPTTLRLVFEVNQKVQVRTSSWQGNGLRIDIWTNDKPIPLAIAKPKASLSPAPIIRTTQMPIPIKHAPKALRDVIVVLDAGHGGKDSGARGPNRSQEKDVVLAISLKLKQLIDKQPGMRAVLTRSGDYYVGLRKRLNIARKYNGDIFVAIHADAFNNQHSNGASVFALSQRGATSEAARWLAEKENYSELGGVNLGELDDQNGMVRSVLIDLSQTATINAGLQMGRRVLTQLGSFTHLHNQRVEQARFVVLKSPDIPSILVETGFISNPREERNLTNPAYQLRLSQAIFQGLKGYFWDNPPPGSRIEAMVMGRSTVAKNTLVGQEKG